MLAATKLLSCLAFFTLGVAENVAVHLEEEKSTVIVRFHGSNRGALQNLKATTRSNVRAALMQHAETTQSAAMGLIQAHVDGAVATSMWIDNTIVIRGASPALIQSLEAHHAILDVRPDAVVSLPAPVPAGALHPPSHGNSTPKPQNNIEKLNTGALWDAGYLGQGVVVATIDSGVRWTHEALRGNYRGFAANPQTVNHDYAMWTPNSTVLTPDTADIYGHGTHVTGTAVGSGPHHIGMAPQATWIHAKAFNWAGATTQSTLLAAAQWVLCPTRYDHSDSNCSLGADVVSCSFGGNKSLTWLNPSVRAMRAAGVLPVFASGNVDAFVCGSVLEPAGCAESVAVGGANDGLLYPSSGKGPGLDGHTIKPDFVAPSMGINSALSAADSGREAYTRLTGTSMACPHVAGAIALLLGANRSADPLAALRSTAAQSFKKPVFAASKCGGIEWNVFPNNVYGWGLPDVCKAAGRLGVQC